MAQSFSDAHEKFKCNKDHDHKSGYYIYSTEELQALKNKPFYLNSDCHPVFLMEDGSSLELSRDDGFYCYRRDYGDKWYVPGQGLVSTDEARKFMANN